MIASVDARLEKNGDRIFGMGEAARMLGARGSGIRSFRETLQHAHRERGDILVRVKHRYYVSESALRSLFPQVFSASRTRGDRIVDMEQRIEQLEANLSETRQTLYKARVRIRLLEDRLRV